jgi:hypothetical protein
MEVALAILFDSRADSIVATVQNDGFTHELLGSVAPQIKRFILAGSVHCDNRSVRPTSMGSESPDVDDFAGVAYPGRYVTCEAAKLADLLAIL